MLSPVDGGSEYRVLFLGNSHTSTNDVPGMVRSLLASSGYKVSTEAMFGGHLDDLEARQDVRDKIDNGKWTHVVLQGAMISSSHKYEYPQDKVVALATRAKKAGAIPLYFAEWPRRDWDESDYIYSHYESSRKEAGGEVIPVCYAWDSVALPEMWSADGNHAALSGSFVAACTIAYWIGGGEASFTFAPSGLDVELAKKLRAAAYKTVVERKKKSTTGPS